jgi:aminopeptidase N
MGDEPFLKMLRALRERYAYRAINNEEFRELCAEFLPAGIPDRSLIDFFDHWVYGTGLPRLALSHSVKGGVLSLTLRQSGVPEDFSVDVPVEIRVAGRKDPIVRWIKTDAEPVQVTLKLPGPLQKVELAPRSGILALQ